MKQLKLSPTKKEHGLKTYIFFDSLHHYPLITLSSSSFFTMQKKKSKNGVRIVVWEKWYAKIDTGLKRDNVKAQDTWGCNASKEGNGPNLPLADSSKVSKSL